MMFIHACSIRPSPAREVAAIVALLNGERLFPKADSISSFPTIIHSSFHHPDGDHLTILNVWRAYYFQVDTVCRGKSQHARVAHLRQWRQEHFLDHESLQVAEKSSRELLSLARRMMQLEPQQEVLPASLETWESPRFSLVLRKTLLRGGFLNIAVRERVGDGYRTLGEHQFGLIHPESVLISREHDFVMYDSYTKTKKCYFINVTGIDSQWLFDDPVASHYVNSLMTNYVINSEKWFPIKPLQTAKAKFERARALAQ